jgi:PAS domain S-box-containing protein
MTAPLAKTRGGTSLGLALRLLARSRDGVIAFDNGFRCLYWNRAMAELTGLQAEDVLGQDLLALFPFLRETGEDVMMRRALAGEEVSSQGRPFSVAGTGRRGLYDASYGPLHEEGGASIAGAIAVIRDVTAEQRAAEVLREAEDRFRNMADAAPVLLWMADTDGLCTFFNQTWLDFTGRSADEEWGVGWAEGVHFEDFQRCMDTFSEAFGQRRVFEMEYRLRRHDGEYRWLLDRGTPRYTPDGTFSGFIGSCIDITERRAFEHQLRRAVAARDEFLSVASHELKTPLTSLQLQIDSLMRYLERRPGVPGEDARLQSGGRAVTDQVRRLGDLVEVLLDVSRINSGRLQFHYAELDLVDLLRDADERWRAAASLVQCDLSLRVVEGRTGTTLKGCWDRLRLEQVLNNLLSNAVKYGPGKPIQLLAAGDDEHVRFSVIDQGIGIPPADHPRIFERFERAVPTRNYGGLGLGLWITHQIVTGLGGTIAVISVPGAGATFEVELPRAREPGAPCAERAATSE